MSVGRSTTIALSLLIGGGCGSDGGADGPAETGDIGTPGAAAVVAPGTLSTDGGESWLSFDPAGQIAIFGRHDSGWGDHTVYVARRAGEGWSEPKVTPFSGVYADRGARLTADGAVLFYSSNRPRANQGEEPQNHFDIWLTQLLPDGWGPPRPLPAPLNTDANELHPSGYVVESLGPALNTEHSEPDVFVDPQQRFLVFARTDDPEGYGGDDLWLSVRTEDGWSTPRNLGPEVNSSEYEYGPALSADGRTLYFTSHRDGDADLFEIDAERVGIPIPRP